MPRVKVPRKSTAIDMTAMCDVASLLLTFFILTATARQPEALTVDTPTSTVKIKLPESNIATITVGQGKVFFGVQGQPIRERVLQKMSERYKVPFSAEDIKRFSLMDNFGVPINQLKQVIDMKGADRNKEGLQPGIPVDSVAGAASQLHEWIYQARVATKEINDESLRISIKGDAKEEYPTIKKIIDILQKQKVNKFSLVTSMEGAD
ncbi:outer membrane transport energization protein ExbD [Arcticibacter pallidicorallinus]|uniref:Outer membrane transport energization protein ExbD n=1 Tax=Arcticibacter pallidicorallinus TaxID=1259464 RepID=A0A2T0TU42_9SPHI|nr:biopolymer transporter ExbD [Arcticibacter pallidicorallinus]PRY49171.1 outer membrane transport energization protein ExbD [Arcticibacter pallidicorallinus]